jgi:hypothetical protein
MPMTAGVLIYNEYVGSPFCFEVPHCKQPSSSPHQDIIVAMGHFFVASEGIHLVLMCCSVLVYTRTGRPTLLRLFHLCEANFMNKNEAHA